jgi:hypothetical protein
LSDEKATTDEQERFVEAEAIEGAEAEPTAMDPAMTTNDKRARRSGEELHIGGAPRFERHFSLGVFVRAKSMQSNMVLTCELVSST